MSNERYCSAHSGVCRKIDAIKEQVELRFTALEKAISATKYDLDIRLEAMNEFRAQLDRQANTFVPRQEIDVTLKRVEDKVDNLKNRSSERKGEIKWLDHIITVLIGLFVILAVWIITKGAP